MRVTIVGSGFVGATAAMRVVQKGLADEVVMVDIVPDLPQGLALDMRESAPIEGFEPNVRGTNEYADTAGLGLVGVTAGGPPPPRLGRVGPLGEEGGNNPGGGGEKNEEFPPAHPLL